MANSHCWKQDDDWYRVRDWYNRKQWVLIPVVVSYLCEHFHTVLYFSFGPCTDTTPVAAQCEYTSIITCKFKTSLRHVEFFYLVTAQLDETQHRTGSLYGGSSQGVDWPTRLFRQQPVLGLRRRARGTST